MEEEENQNQNTNNQDSSNNTEANNSNSAPKEETVDVEKPKEETVDVEKPKEETVDVENKEETKENTNNPPKENIQQKRSNLSNNMSTNSYKRNTAYKFRVGQIMSAKQNYDSERLRSIEINQKEVLRVNIIANIIDKFLQEGEKQYATITLDDATGQIKAKTFGEDVEKFKELNQGDTVMVIGMVRAWNNELYVTPEIIKKKDPSFLLIRKLEVEAATPQLPSREELTELKDKIISKVKESEENGGIDIEKLIMDLKESPGVINNEVKKLLEEGIAYEPRPGKLRWLG